MITQSILDYIAKEKGRGIDDESIRTALTQVGWEQIDIEGAFRKYHEENPVNITPHVETEEPEKVVNKRLIQKFPLKYKLLFITMFLLILTSAMGLFFVRLAPTRVLSEVYKNVSELERFDYTLNTNINVENGGDSANGTTKYSFSVSSQGHIDGDESGKTISSQDITLSVQNLLTTSFELRNFGDEIFVKFKDFPDYGFISKDMLTKNWITFNLKDYDQDLTEEKSLTENDQKTLNDFTKKNPILVIKEVMDEEKVNGFDSYRYKYEINKDNLKSFVRKIAELQGDSESEFNDDFVNDLFDRITFYDGEIYIDKDLKLPRKLSFAVRFLVGDKEKNDNLTIDSVWEFSKFNEENKIDKPDDAVPVQDLYSKYLEEIQNETGTEVPPEFILPDVQVDPQGITLFNELPKVLGAEDN